MAEEKIITCTTCNWSGLVHKDTQRIIWNLKACLDNMLVCPACSGSGLQVVDAIK